jgi:hypothetical protein
MYSPFRTLQWLFAVLPLQLGQVGGGHFSPIAGYSEEHDMALVLDVVCPPSFPLTRACFTFHTSSDPIECTVPKLSFGTLYNHCDTPLPLAGTIQVCAVLGTR